MTYHRIRPPSTSNSGTGVGSLGHLSRWTKPHDVRVLYAIYGSSFVTIVVAAIALWASAHHRPILFSYQAGLWVQANPNTTTIICTIIGTLAAAVTLLLLNRLLLLMTQKLITTKGLSLSVLDRESPPNLLTFLRFDTDSLEPAVSS